MDFAGATVIQIPSNTLIFTPEKGYDGKDADGI